MRKRFLFSSANVSRALACAVFCLSSQAFGALQIGEILKPSGPTAKVNGKAIQASIPLFWGDRLFTGPDTTLDVIVYPSFALKLKPSSEVRLIGNLIEKNGSKLMASTAVQAIRGRIQGHLISGTVSNDLKILARRTISSIRGTTFEICATECGVATDEVKGDALSSEPTSESKADALASADVKVFEGTVEVEPLVKSAGAASNPAPVAVSGGEKFVAASTAAVTSSIAAPTDLVSGAAMDEQWKKDEAVVLSAHAKEAKKYREILDRDVKSVSASMRKDARGMFRSIKGSYDQFKKKK